MTSENKLTNAKQQIDFWVGKVADSKDEISDALDVLKNTQITAKQLQREINLWEAEEQHQYTPY